MIKGYPTNYGIEVLNSELKAEVQTYALLGLDTPKNAELETLIEKMDLDYTQISNYIFHTDKLAVGYFDDEGILTYEINLQNINANKYMFAIVLLDTQNQVVASLPTPQIMLIDGIGGLVTIKLPIKGAVQEVIFVNSDYVSRNEFEVLKRTLKVPEVDIPALVKQVTPLIQSKKDFYDRANNVLDKCINHLRLVQLYRRDRKRDNDRIGEYRLFFRSSLPQGFKPMGSILPIIKYPLAWKYFKDTYPRLQDNMPSGYFRLPPPRLYTKGTDNPLEVGAQGQEGLPNITGGTTDVGTERDRHSASGAFFLQVSATFGFKNSYQDFDNPSFHFDASRSNPIYGRSDSVEVAHNKLLEGIYVGGGHKLY